MSSAILYLAIVAIWAGVLIPRWLRRDSSPSSSSGSSGASGASGDEASTAEPDSAAGQEPAPRSRRREESGHAAQARTAVRPDARPEAPGARREAQPVSRPQRDLERKRVLSARRRLLGMLLVLVIGSGALAVTKWAAWWVVVPPSVMLLAYMGLLREASRADAERRELVRTRAADAAAAAPAAPAAPPAPAPTAEVIDISASLGSAVQAGEEFYDQYADAKLRAVGDLVSFS